MSEIYCVDDIGKDFAYVHTKDGCTGRIERELNSQGFTICRTPDGNISKFEKLNYLLAPNLKRGVPNNAVK